MAACRRVKVDKAAYSCFSNQRLHRGRLKLTGYHTKCAVFTAFQLFQMGCRWPRFPGRGSLYQDAKVQCLVDFSKNWSFLQLNWFEVSEVTTRHLPAAFAIMFAICSPKKSARSNVTPRSFGRGVKRSSWPSRWIVGYHPASCRLLGKNATLPFLRCLLHSATRVTASCTVARAVNLQGWLQSRETSSASIATSTPFCATVFRSPI